MLAALVIDVVVPARDHAATLPAVLKGVPARDIRSGVVVDRASRDRTAEGARDAGALVLREPSGGYGAACQRAQAHFSALPRVPEIVVFVPGDRPRAAECLPALVAPIVERGLDVALGMRDRGAGWDVEMLVRASKLGLTSDELDLPSEATGGRTRLGPHALLHILRHSTMR